jgi:uncharacterized delta-60 repeat protein
MRLIFNAIAVIAVLFFTACGGESNDATVLPQTDLTAVGALDTSFDSVGYTTHDSAAGGAGIDVAEDAVIDASGNIIVVGYSHNGTNYDMAIWRYKDDGSLDPGFNGVGYVTHDGAAGGSGADAGISVTIDTNGKVLVAGYSYNGTNSDMTVWRYNSDGTLDTGFNTVGYVSHDNLAGGSGNDRANALLIDANGKIVVAGYSSNGTDFDMALWRFNSNGSLDTSTSHHNAAGGAGSDIGRAIAMDNNNKLLITGYSYNGTDNDMSIWRYDTAFSLDTSFNTTGFATHNNAAGGAGNDEGEAIGIDSDGNIVVAGFSVNGSNEDMSLWRYTAAGSLDTSFNTSGVVTHNSAAGGNGNDEGKSLAFDSNGKILVTGFSSNGTDNDMSLWRYTASGSLDTDFNTLGFITHNSAAGGSGYDEGSAVLIDNNEKIVIAGRSFNGSNNDMAVWRYK